MTKYIFPGAIIILNIGAGIVYAFKREIWLSTYFFAAAVLNFSVLKQ